MAKRAVAAIVLVTPFILGAAFVLDLGGMRSWFGREAAHYVQSNVPTSLPTPKPTQN